MVRSIFALAAVLSVATASLAKDLVTPAVYVGDKNTVICKLLNITSAPVTAQVQLVEAYGKVLWDSGPQTLAAEGPLEIGDSYPQTKVFCRFVNASLSKFRGALVEASNIDATDIVVVPAQ